VGQLCGEGEILLFSMRAVTKSEHAPLMQAGKTSRSTGGPGARYLRFPRLDAGQTVFGFRNKVGPLKILEQLMTRKAAPLL
jgi:hypothetical protein